MEELNIDVVLLIDRLTNSYCFAVGRGCMGDYVVLISNNMENKYGAAVRKINLKKQLTKSGWNVIRDAFIACNTSETRSVDFSALKGRYDQVPIRLDVSDVRTVARNLRDQDYSNNFNTIVFLKNL